MLDPQSSLQYTCTLLQHAEHHGLQGVEFWAVNTDAQALEQSLATNRVQIGSELTRGLGTGGNPQLGEHAAQESAEALKACVNNGDMVRTPAPGLRQNVARGRPSGRHSRRRGVWHLTGGC